MFKNKKVWTYLVIVGIAVICALNYQLFVFPNKFAPAGLNGLCTMFQYVTGISMGYLSIVINIPLAILVYFKVSRDIAKRSMVYVAVFSGMLVLLDQIDLSTVAYHTENGTSAILGPLTAGIIFGTCYSMLVRISTQSGGTDFVSTLIHKNHPELNFFYVTFTINCLVAGLSFFVYDYKIEPVLMCIIYSFTSSTITDRLSKGTKTAIRLEIITRDPEALSREIIENLHHTATLIPAQGAYSGKPTNVLICIVNKSQAVAVREIIERHPGSFAVVSQATSVYGNFKKYDKSGNLEVSRLDAGDGQSVIK